VVGREGVEQCGRTAGERGALVQVGHERGKVVDVETALHVRVVGDEADQPGIGEGAQVGDEDRVGLARRHVDDGDVVIRTAPEPDDAGVGDREQVAQHPDDRGDARAGRHEQQLRPVEGQHEISGRLLQVHQGACRGALDQVGADFAVRDRLDGDRDAAVGAGAVGQRVGAP